MADPVTVIWRGVKVDPRTSAMLDELARLTPNLPMLNPTQGSFSTSVSPSAGTHDRGGAVDISVGNLTLPQVIETVRVGRTVGFAMWRRLPSEGPWPEHIHGIAIDCPDLSDPAERQVTAYRNGLNGLASGNADPHASLGVPVVTWEQYLDKKKQEDDMPYNDWPQADKDNLAADVARQVHVRSVQAGSAVEPLGQAVGRTLAGVRRLEASQVDFDKLAAAIVSKLPAGSMDVELVKAGLREVLAEGGGA